MAEPPPLLLLRTEFIPLSRFFRFRFLFLFLFLFPLHSSRPPC